MLPSSISVLNVSNMDSWSRFSKSSTGTGAVNQRTKHIYYIEKIKRAPVNQSIMETKIVRTIGFGEQREYISSKLVGFLEGVAATPLVLDGHLKGIPAREKQKDTLLEESPREWFFCSPTVVLAPIDGIHQKHLFVCWKKERGSRQPAEREWGNK